MHDCRHTHTLNCKSGEAYTVRPSSTRPLQEAHRVVSSCSSRDGSWGAELEDHNPRELAGFFRYTVSPSRGSITTEPICVCVCVWGGYGECVSVWGEGGMVSVCVKCVHSMHTGPQ